MKSKYFNYLNFIIGAINACRKPDTWHNLKKCDILLVRHDWDCGYNYCGKAYGPLIDTLGDLFIQKGLTVQSVASPFSFLVGKSAHNDPVSFNRASFSIYFLGLFIRKIKGRANYSIWSKNHKIKLWEKILTNSKPHCVIGIMPDEALCNAARLNNIVIYDLQHGVIADEHYYYGCLTRAESEPNDIPNCYLCWDTPSEKILKKWISKKDTTVYIIGNPWFLRFAFPHTNDILGIEAINSGKIFNNNKPSILFSLQWGMEIDYHKPEFNGVMISVMEKIILETSDKYNWLLRLHPIQLLGTEKRSSLTYLNSTFGNIEGVEWRKSSELPLPVILQQTDLHITDSSTVTIEASWFGIQTGLLNQQIKKDGNYKSYFLNERENGFAHILPQIKDIIKEWISERLSQSVLKKVSYLDKNEALLSFIDETVFNAVSKRETN